MPILKVGNPFPGKLEDTGGLASHMEPTKGKEGIESMFVVSLPEIHPREFDALIREPIRFGILLYEPLVFIVLEAPGTTLIDSPFGLGLYPPEVVTALLASAHCAYEWSVNIRRSTIIAVVDPLTMIVRGLRKTTLTRDWWIALSDALERCPVALSRSEYTDAIQRAYSRWDSPADMLRDCTIIEESGI
jgi:hypothetical protein